MAIIDDIKNRLGETVYPRTLMNAVYNEENKNLNDFLSEEEEERRKGIGLSTEVIELQGTNPTIDLSLGNTFKHTITENTNYKIAERLDDDIQRFDLIIIQDTAPKAIMFPKNIRWDKGEVPAFDFLRLPFVLSFTKLKEDDSWFGTFKNKPKPMLPSSFVWLESSMLDVNGWYEGVSKNVAVPEMLGGKIFEGSSDLFRGSNIERVYTEGNSVTDMTRWFFGTTSPILELSVFDTSRVTSMNGTFGSCPATELDLSTFDTGQVTNMGGMFRDTIVTELDISHFDTKNVTNTSAMFQGSALTAIDLTNFDTSKVRNMNNMFQDSNIEVLDLSSFDTSSVGTSVNNMFEGAKATVGYARTQADADKFNASPGKPAGLNFVVKS